MTKIREARVAALLAKASDLWDMAVGGTESYSPQPTPHRPSSTQRDELFAAAKAVRLRALVLGSARPV